MEYSAVSASLSIGDAIFVVPHLLIGFVLLFFGCRGQSIMRGASGKNSLFIQIPAGALFFGLACWTIYNGIFDTLRCREAESKGEYQSLSGEVKIIERFSKPGAGYVRFKIGEIEIKTNESGSSCDCGFIFPLGKTIRIKDGMNVDVKASGRSVIFLKVNSSG